MADRMSVTFFPLRSMADRACSRRLSSLLRSSMLCTISRAWARSDSLYAFCRVRSSVYIVPMSECAAWTHCAHCNLIQNILPRSTNLLGHHLDAISQALKRRRQRRCRRRRPPMGSGGARDGRAAPRLQHARRPQRRPMQPRSLPTFK